MTTRRTFIKTVAAIPPALSFRRGWATNPDSPDPSRLALIIGNSAYRDAPLFNSANDARAVAGLFTQAGFTVDLRLNVTRTDMMAAIERFGAAAKRPDTKLVVFFYAGHGAQLDWRNYLLPVDAVVKNQEHMKQRCVDLSLLLAQLSAAKDKTFIVILDACRNNPFGTSYRPEQKGLSQFDAPVGSLLAYATSPGNVAFDGDGENGLYTENLLRELSQRGARIEDALKRVRLNVRLASHGEQIPWETTSLEGDVFIFNEGQKKLTEAELEKLVEADVGEWARIKSSRKIDDWVSYLRSYPSGRFAEIAQMRLNRLLAETEKSKPAPTSLASTAPSPAPAAEASPPPAADQRPAAPPGPIQALSSAPAVTSAAGLPPNATRARIAAPMIAIRAGVAVPLLIAPSANPYSAGRYPLGRIYTVGDSASIRQTDILTGLEERTYGTRVTKVDRDRDWVEYNDGASLSDLMGNYIKTGSVEFDTPVQLTPAEFQIGKKWTATFRRTEYGATTNAYFNMKIAKRETITVPAGSFDSFRIEGEGWDTTGGLRLELKQWLVPRLNFAIRIEKMYRDRRGNFFMTERQELVALRQYVI